MRKRLDRHLGEKGLATRQEAARLVKAGRVLVNGSPASSPAAHIDPDADRIYVDGMEVDRQRHYHLLMNKPSGVLTAARDARCKTVLDLLEHRYQASGCMPVGRLDKDTTGLLLFTTDGQLAHNLLSPKRHVDKVYRALLARPVNEADVRAFSAGIHLSDFTAQPAELLPLEGHWAQVIIHEGKFHQVKRMFQAVGNEVLSLSRMAFAGLNLTDTLEPGAYRALDEGEIERLYSVAFSKGEDGHV